MSHIIEYRTPEPKSRICKSCGTQFLGYYCNMCGEKVLDLEDRSFKTFLSNVQITTTFTDNKFLKTLKLIVTKPGFLSKEYAQGRRVSYMRPLQLFFIL